MISLYRHIETSANRDANGEWNWSHNPWRMDFQPDVDDYLKRLADKDQVTLIPVKRWGTKPKVEGLYGEGWGFPTDPTLRADELGKKYGMHVNHSVYKLNLTGAANSDLIIKRPSLFISPNLAKNDPDVIRPGKKYILVDDVLETGCTLRDLIRHVNNHGGEVIQCITKNGAIGVGDPPPSERAIEYTYALLWALSKRQGGDPEFKEINTVEKAKEMWEKQPEAIKSDVLFHFSTPLQARVGVTIEQLTAHELRNLDKLIECLIKNDPENRNGLSQSFSMDDFWESIISPQHIKEHVHPHNMPLFRPWPKVIEEINEPQALARALGTIFDHRWALQLEQQKAAYHKH